MTDTDEPMDDDDALAGEYVLGLLDGTEKLAFERRLATDPQLRQAVFAWERLFAEMVDSVPEVAPPSRVRHRVLAEITPVQRRSRLRWRIAAGLFAMASVAAIALFIVFDRDRGFRADYVAELVSESGDLRIAAAFDREAGVLVLNRLAGGSAPDRALELWLIADGAAAPVSLGVLPEETEFRISLEGDLGNTIPGATFAVSDEPTGGSPTGQPTGTVLALGQVQPN